MSPMSRTLYHFKANNNIVDFGGQNKYKSAVSITCGKSPGIPEWITRSLQTVVAISQRYYRLALTSKAGSVGNNDRKWLLNPVTSIVAKVRDTCVGSPLNLYDVYSSDVRMVMVIIRYTFFRPGSAWVSFWDCYRSFLQCWMEKTELWILWCPKTGVWTGAAQGMIFT